jgi:hypothetical protein
MGYNRNTAYNWRVTTNNPLSIKLYETILASRVYVQAMDSVRNHP